MDLIRFSVAQQYIDWYNATRRHSFNSGMSPIKKELAAYTRIAA
jgi:hypothetical protein